jgi:hypothetical protein
VRTYPPTCNSVYIYNLHTKKGMIYAAHSTLTHKPCNCHLLCSTTTNRNAPKWSHITTKQGWSIYSYHKSRITFNLVQIWLSETASISKKFGRYWQSPPGIPGFAGQDIKNSRSTNIVQTTDLKSWELLLGAYYSFSFYDIESKHIFSVVKHKKK